MTTTDNRISSPFRSPYAGTSPAARRDSVRRNLLFLFVSILLPANAQESAAQKAIKGFEDYLNMAGSQTANDFRPLNQHERAHVYLKSMVNPWSFVKAAASAGLDHSHTKPNEWGQGWGPLERGSRT